MGTNQGSFRLVLIQSGGAIHGMATMHEPRLGTYHYSVEGTFSDPLHLKLIPSSQPTSFALGILNVSGQFQEQNTFDGDWKSTIGTRGTFRVVRSQQTPSIGDATPRRTRVFISYAHQDRDFHRQLMVHLRPIERAGRLDVWSDTKISPGSDWKHEIGVALHTASVAVLLVSPDFLASEFVVSDELPTILSREEKDGLRVLPLILRPCRFARDVKLSRFQAINAPDEPLSGLDIYKRDAYYDRLAQEIEHSNSPA